MQCTMCASVQGCHPESAFHQTKKVRRAVGTSDFSPPCAMQSHRAIWKLPVVLLEERQAVLVSTCPAAGLILLLASLGNPERGWDRIGFDASDHQGLLGFDKLGQREFWNRVQHWWPQLTRLRRPVSCLSLGCRTDAKLLLVWTVRGSLASLPRGCDRAAVTAVTVLVVVIVEAPICWVRLVPTFIRITQFILSRWLGEVHVGVSPAVVVGMAVSALNSLALQWWKAGQHPMEGLPVPRLLPALEESELLMASGRNLGWAGQSKTHRKRALTSLNEEAGFQAWLSSGPDCSLTTLHFCLSGGVFLDRFLPPSGPA